YSRGAWVGTGCGLGYLAWWAVQSLSNAEWGVPPDLRPSGQADVKAPGVNLSAELGNIEHEPRKLSGRASNTENRMAEAGPSSQSEMGTEARPRPGRSPRGEGGPPIPFWRVRTNVFFSSIIVFSILALAFWQFRQTEWHTAHRAFSVGNQNDFSWRNRVAAWEGALQIMAETPWFGAGWNQTERLYEHYYLSPKVNESSAIEMNDYLMLGATLGVPALFCFGMYVWLSLMGNVQGPKSNVQILGQGRESEWLKVVCRTGAIVLLLGFWFDGGLFKLATASTFWILLELGRNDGHEKAQESQKREPRNKWQGSELGREK